MWHTRVGLSSVVAALTVVAATQLAVGGRMHASAQDHDPGAPHPVAVVQYDLGDTAFTDPRTGTVSEIRAVVHYPQPINGRLPLIVMAHGSWFGCDSKDAAAWPCPAGSHAFPSYRGYDYLGTALAASGFVAVSISVDAINITSFDYGDRARLINEHLRLWQQLATAGSGPLVGSFVDPGTGSPVAPPFTGHVDMTRVGTLGHSRGGKGVMWQASDKHRSEWPAGVNVRAVLGLAPVKFDDPAGDHSDTLITRLPFTVVTGSCDGAVHEQGKEYLDDVTGQNSVADYWLSLHNANHNYYNVNWSPPFQFGDDDSTCPSQELTPDQQRSALTTYALAFYRYELDGDRTAEHVLTGKQPLSGVISEAHVTPPAHRAAALASKPLT